MNGSKPIGGAYTWLNAKFVVKVLLSASKSATHTEDQTEHGKLTLEAWELSLTVHPRKLTFAQAAFVQTRLPELSE